MKAREVTEFDDFLVQLVERMMTLMDDAQGVGLAATQVGVVQRLFVFSPGEEGTLRGRQPALVESRRRPRPRRRAASRSRGSRAGRALDEGDPRRRRPAGDALRFELEGLAARVVQHELDHLDGVLIIDRTDAEHRREALGILRPQIVLR